LNKGQYYFVNKDKYDTKRQDFLTLKDNTNSQKLATQKLLKQSFQAKQCGAREKSVNYVVSRTFPILLLIY